MNSTAIVVNVTSATNNSNTSYIRIDTIIVDQTQIQATNLVILDFQTINIPTNPSHFILAAPSDP